MSRLPLPKICALAAVSRRLYALSKDTCRHSRLVHELGGGTVDTGESRDWKRMASELSSLKAMWWQRKHTEEDPNAASWPRPRWGHTITVIDYRSILLFGGESDGATNDVHVLDTVSNVWREIEPAPSHPPPRCPARPLRKPGDC